VNFTETPEQRALRQEAAALGSRYGYAYFTKQARSGGKLTQLWQEAGRLGFIGVNLPEEHGGGGAGLYELALVLEELAAAGCGLLMMVVSPAICGTILARFGTEQQKKQWLPRLASGAAIMAFGITEPDAGSNSHKLSTVATRDGDTWVLTGRKIYISGVDEAEAVLIVGRTADATPRGLRGSSPGSHSGKLRPALFIVRTDAPGFSYRPLEMDILAPEKQFLLFLDDVRLPADALIGDHGAGLPQLFAGLNPERIMAAALAIGSGRYALAKAVGYARERVVWDVPIGAHQGVAHPLAQVKIELELARLMMQKAAATYDAGDDMAAGEAANMAKYAAGEASVRAVDQAVQTLGGSSMTAEFGLAAMLASVRTTRLAPVSREMILNFVAQHSLGLPKSY
jgi:alkylation response protein AidB-like acyl-CoA dehydrogenase